MVGRWRNADGACWSAMASRIGEQAIPRTFVLETVTIESQTHALLGLTLPRAESLYFPNVGAFVLPLAGEPPAVAVPLSPRHCVCLAPSGEVVVQQLRNWAQNEGTLSAFSIGVGTTIAGFGRVCEECFYPFSTQLRGRLRARWRAGARGGGKGRRHRGNATAAQHSAHAGRSAGSLRWPRPTAARG
jgi:hypothetical protein